MSDDFERDLRKSAPDFPAQVWPVLQRLCPAFREGRLCVVEGLLHNPIALDLDRVGGIDAYHRGPFFLRGMATRIQWGTDYRTFTIREARPSGARTEYAKRLEVLNHLDEGFLYPYWTIQAYLTQPGGTVLSVAVAKTIDLYRYLERYESSLPRIHARNGGETFLVVDWKHYRREGHYLFVYASSPPDHMKS